LLGRSTPPGGGGKKMGVRQKKLVKMLW